jgi:ubiquinone/menaquinone biosynthesis C-methylase UbiE
MLRRARQRLSDHPGGAPVLVADAGRLPFADGAFGAVISTGVLTVIPDPLPVLREARRVVRPGGRMAFVEMIPPQRKTVVSQAWIWALQRLRDRFHDIPQLLAELGLQVVDQEIGRAGTVHLVTAEVQ